MLIADGIYIWDKLTEPTLAFENVTLRGTAANLHALSPYTNQPGFVPMKNAPVGLDSLSTVSSEGLTLTNVTGRPDTSNLALCRSVSGLFTGLFLLNCGGTGDDL